MKITVMGPGGVGGYFGARLAAAGNDVTFVARGSHFAAMKKDGLRLDSDIGKLHLRPVQVVADAGEIAAADAVIFAVKLQDTGSAAQSLKPLVAKADYVFPLAALVGAPLCKKDPIAATTTMTDTSRTAVRTRTRSTLAS